MIFSARTARPTSLVRLRSRLLGAAAGVLVAVPLGATAGLPVTVPLDAAAPAGPQRMPVAPAATSHDVLTTATPAEVVAAPPSADRVPSSPGGRATLTPPSPRPSTLPRSAPTHVRIPAIEVDSELVRLGLQDDGRMEVPPGAFPAGWYTGAPTPGELGPAILAGHVDHGDSTGVFLRLRDLQPGDRVEVTREDGRTAVFRVTRVEQHPKDAFPTAAVYGDIDHAGLRLITCGGPFDRRVRSYEDNIVVFAELDPGAGPSGADSRRS